MILETLSLIRPGITAGTWSYDQLGDFLRETVIKSKADEQRRAAARIRNRLYHSEGKTEMEALIDSIFDDPFVRQKRKELVDVANYFNLIRRLVLEKSTLYRAPATRKVDDRDDNYQQAIAASRLHEVMQSVNAMVSLHNDVLIGVRSRDVRGRKVPVIDVITPANFAVIPHPFDGTQIYGVIIDRFPGYRPKPDQTHYVVWTDTETFEVDANGRLTTEITEHNLLGMPFVHATVQPTTARGAILDSTTGADMVAGHQAVWLQELLLNKEAKSATKQTVFSGDTGRMPMGQSADSEGDLITGDGVSVQTVDRGMDLQQFRENADHIAEAVASNHGIPPAVLRHAGATSGYEMMLRRLPILEIRDQQKPAYRQIERQLCEVMAEVISADIPAMAFGADGFSVNFGEVQVPLSPNEENQTFEQSRRLGLTNTLEELMRRDPDLDYAGALAKLTGNINAETTRIALMREMTDLSGAPREEAPAPDGEDSTAGGQIVRMR